MKIRVYVKDLESNEALEELGEVITSSPSRALQMYAESEMPWADRGYEPALCYEDISDPAARSLGRRGGKSTSEAKSAAARANGRKGGRPRKK